MKSLLISTIQGILMYATNIHEFGHMKKIDTYSTTRKNGDLYQLFDNEWVNECFFY